MSRRSLDITLNGLEDLGPNFQYEHWLILDDVAESIGVFNITDTSTTYESSVPVTKAQTKATKYVLTIEPNPDPSPEPAATHVVAGTFDEIQIGGAVLSVADPAALGNDFTGSAGQFILSAPTGNSQPYENGIWWLIPPTPDAGLTLPVLPAGWIYEGWVASAAGPVSTGTFSSATGADSDGAGATAGPNTAAAPPFPGQDFVVPTPVDLTDGYTAVISIEPQPDNSPGPFAYKPLVKAIGDVAPPDTQTMDQNLDSFATGLAVFDSAAPSLAAGFASLLVFAVLGLIL